MGIINQLQPNPYPEGLGSIDWAEYTGDGNGIQELSYGYDGNQAMYTFMVNWDDRDTAINELLGSNELDVGTMQLSRTLPAPHPVRRELYCDRVISVKPYKLLSKTNVNGVATTDYLYAIITARFSMPKWLLTIDDSTVDRVYGAPRAEWARFCSYHSSPSTESLSREPGTFVYTESSATGPPLIPVKTPVTLTLAQFLYRVEFTVRWHRVPSFGLIGQQTLLPNNLLKYVNTVNIGPTPFLGQAPGTLLFKGYHLTPCENPDPFSQVLTVKGLTPICYDVDLIFGIWDPPPAPGNTTHGWNLQPWNDSYWYMAGYKGNPTIGLIPAQDHRNIFQMTL